MEDVLEEEPMSQGTDKSSMFIDGTYCHNVHGMVFGLTGVIRAKSGPGNLAKG
jgi:hypothetical protein